MATTYTKNNIGNAEIINGANFITICSTTSSDTLLLEKHLYKYTMFIVSGNEEQSPTLFGNNDSLTIQLFSEVSPDSVSTEWSSQVISLSKWKDIKTYLIDTGIWGGQQIVAACGSDKERYTRTTYDSSTTKMYWWACGELDSPIKVQAYQKLNDCPLSTETNKQSYLQYCQIF